MTQITAPSHSAASGSVAAAILKRRNERQRFDSADFAMAQQQKQQQHTRLRLPSCGELASPAVPAPTSLDSSDDFSDWVQCELEPEPEANASSTCVSSGVVVPPQHVPRIRLQRFDSADWAMQCHHETTAATAATVESTLAGTVAKLRLDRHAYTTCSFVNTPIDPPAQHFVKNA